jgi:hypothetical protein
MYIACPLYSVQYSGLYTVVFAGHVGCNEIINIIGNQIHTAIVDKCNASTFFALIADETTDTSTREQVSVCLRYIQRDSFSGDVSIKEDFLELTM